LSRKWRSRQLYRAERRGRDRDGARQGHRPVRLPEEERCGRTRFGVVVRRRLRDADSLLPLSVEVENGEGNGSDKPGEGEEGGRPKTVVDGGRVGKAEFHLAEGKKVAWMKG
jgi:hypothetical protein